MLKKPTKSIKELIIQLHKCCILNNYHVFNYESTNNYNNKIIKDGKQCTLLPTNQLIICIGNNKMLWNNASKLLQKKYKNPFDIELNQNITSKLGDLIDSYEYENENESNNFENDLEFEIDNKMKLKYEVFYTHVAKPYLVSFQDLAIATNIGTYHNGTSLIIHPLYGPWIGLRFALVVDVPYDMQLDLHQYKLEHLDSSSNSNGSGNSSSSSSSSSDIHSDINSGKNVFETMDSISISISEAEAESNNATLIMSNKQYTPQLHIAARSAFCSYDEYKYCNEQMKYHYHL